MTSSMTMWSTEATIPQASKTVGTSIRQRTPWRAASGAVGPAGGGPWSWPWGDLPSPRASPPLVAGPAADGRSKVNAAPVRAVFGSSMVALWTERACRSAPCAPTTCSTAGRRGADGDRQAPPRSGTPSRTRRITTCPCMARARSRQALLGGGVVSSATPIRWPAPCGRTSPRGGRPPRAPPPGPRAPLHRPVRWRPSRSTATGAPPRRFFHHACAPDRIVSVAASRT